MMFVPNQIYYYPCPTYNTFAPVNYTNNEVQQRTRFTKAEDELLKQLVESQTQPKWSEIAQKLKNRTARQCRERYNNYLRPNLINGPWSQQEDELLMQLYEKHGPKWALFSQYFNSRSPVNIKNHHSSLVSHLAFISRKVEVNSTIENESHETIKEVIENKNEFQADDKIDNENNFEIDGDSLWSELFVPLDGDNLISF